MRVDRSAAFDRVPGGMRSSRSVKSAGLMMVFWAAIASCSGPEPRSSEPVPVNDPLHRTIAGMDSALFAAFNAHDPALLASYFTSDLEFYHDKDGLSGFDTTMKRFEGLFERNKDSGLRRDLVPGSLQVYALGESNALEICEHRFIHLENGQEVAGTFKNIMIWNNINGYWKVSRVISYDH